jgi:hypothetical protein
MRNKTDQLIIITCILIVISMILLLLSGCAVPVEAKPPVRESVAMMRAETVVEPLPQLVATARVVDLKPDEPVSKRLAVYDPDMWEYPYRDWVSTEIPEGEPWEGWYATTATGKVTVEWEYSTALLYGGIELSPDLKNWYRGRCLEHFYFQFKDGKRKQKVAFIMTADPVTGKTDRQFVRINFPFMEILEGVKQ